MERSRAMGMHIPGEHHGRWAGAAIAALLGVGWLAAFAWFLTSLHRGADALKTQARVEALTKVPEAFTEEERAELTHKIAVRTLAPL